MNKEHFHFIGDFKICLMNVIYKIILKNDLKGLFVGTDTDKLFPFLGFGDPPVKVHPPCHLYLLLYYCPTNTSYTYLFNHYMYFAVENRKVWIHISVMCWVMNGAHIIMSRNHVLPKEKDVEEDGTISKDGTLIKTNVDKAFKFTKNCAKPIQDEINV